jgi:hypothetical protein
MKNLITKISLVVLLISIISLGWGCLPPQASERIDIIGRVGYIYDGIYSSVKDVYFYELVNPNILHSHTYSQDINDGTYGFVAYNIDAELASNLVVGKYYHLRLSLSTGVLSVYMYNGVDLQDNAFCNLLSIPEYQQIRINNDKSYITNSEIIVGRVAIIDNNNQVYISPDNAPIGRGDSYHILNAHLLKVGYVYNFSVHERECTYNEYEIIETTLQRLTYEIPQLDIISKVTGNVCIDNITSNISFSDGHSYIIRTDLAPNIIEGQYYHFRLSPILFYEIYQEGDFIQLVSENLTSYPSMIKGRIIHTSALLGRYNHITLSNNVTYWVRSNFAFPFIIDVDYEFTTTPAGEIVGYK